MALPDDGEHRPLSINILIMRCSRAQLSSISNTLGYNGAMDWKAPRKERASMTMGDALRTYPVLEEDVGRGGLRRTEVERAFFLDARCFVRS